EAGPHELAEPLENLRDLQRPGQQASGLDEALLLGRAARDPLVEARVLDRDRDLVGDDLEQLFLVGLGPRRHDVSRHHHAELAARTKCWLSRLSSSTWLRSR